MVHKELKNTGQMAAESIAKGDITGWFEELYIKSAGDSSVIPWGDQKPNPYLVEWLEKYSVNGESRKTLVIGCGLGDDAEELSRRGFNVTAFDIAPTAIEWAKKRFADSGVVYRVADLFDLPKQWLGSFDFVFECYTIQALPRSVRTSVIDNVASLVSQNGELLIICRGWNDDQTEDNLPWALKKEELEQFKALGFSEISFEEFWDRDDSDRYRFRVLYKNSMATI